MWRWRRKPEEEHRGGWLMVLMGNGGVETLTISNTKAPRCTREQVTVDSLITWISGGISQPDHVTTPSTARELYSHLTLKGQNHFLWWRKTIMSAVQRVHEMWRKESVGNDLHWVIFYLLTLSDGKQQAAFALFSCSAERTNKKELKSERNRPLELLFCLL